jgi:hypothetical protein
MDVFRFSNFAAWKDATGNTFTTGRSPELKHLDEVLKDHFENKKTKTDLRNAFLAWTQSKEQGDKPWKNGTRDKNGAMSAIAEYVNVQIYVRGQLTADEKTAARAIEEANQAALAVLFGEVEFHMKATAVQALLSKVSAIDGTAAAVKNGGKIAPAPTGEGNELMQRVVGPHLVGQLADVAAKTLPIINIIVSGGVLVKSLIDIVTTANMNEKITGNDFAIANGDPAKALEAVQQLLERKATAAKVGALSAGAGLSAALLSGVTGGISGAVVGLAKSVFDMLEAYYIAGREAQEFEAGKAAIKAHKLDFSIFQKCPLLGAYFLTCSDTSAIVNMAVSEYGSPGWNYDVEILVKRIDALLSAARDLIRESNFELTRLAQDKGKVVNSKYTVLKWIPVGKYHQFQQDINRAFGPKEFVDKAHWKSPQEAAAN